MRDWEVSDLFSKPLMPFSDLRKWHHQRFFYIICSCTRPPNVNYYLLLYFLIRFLFGTEVLLRYFSAVSFLSGTEVLIRQYHSTLFLLGTEVLARKCSTLLPRYYLVKASSSFHLVPISVFLEDFLPSCAILHFNAKYLFYQRIMHL